MKRAEAPDGRTVETVTARIAMALLVGTLAFSPGLALAEEDSHSIEALAVEMAETPGQHAALAQHFRAKAEDARAEIRRHQEMGRSYGRRGGKTTVTQRQRMKRHCDNIAEKHAAMAADYEALAELHEEESKAAE